MGAGIAGGMHHAGGGDETDLALAQQVPVALNDHLQHTLQHHGNILGPGVVVDLVGVGIHLQLVEVNIHIGSTGLRIDQHVLDAAAQGQRHGRGVIDFDAVELCLLGHNRLPVWSRPRV